MRVLVTGGAGFIGSAVCRHLVKNTKASVVNVDKLTYAGNTESLAEIADTGRHELVRADICDAKAMADTFAKYEPDLVMHLAAESHVDRSITGPSAFIETNIVGTFTMLEAARAYRDKAPAGRRDGFRFLHVSTDEVYGSLGDGGLFKETTPYDPSSPYSASKAAGDHLAMAWARTFDMPVVVSNCSNNYGPYHFPEKLIPLMILNALDGKSLPVYGDGSNVRDWLYVEDHARALFEIATRGRIGEAYNVGGRNERTNLQIVETICDLVDAAAPSQTSRRSLIQFVTDRPGHDKRYAIDPTKIESQLGWRSQVDVTEGLKRTVRWYLDNSWWWQPLRKGVYGGERLGLSQ